MDPNSTQPPTPAPGVPVAPQPETTQAVTPAPAVEQSAPPAPESVQQPTPTVTTPAAPAEPAGPPPVVFPQEQAQLQTPPAAPQQVAPAPLTPAAPKAPAEASTVQPPSEGDGPLGQTTSVPQPQPDQAAPIPSSQPTSQPQPQTGQPDVVSQVESQPKVDDSLGQAPTPSPEQQAVNATTSSVPAATTQTPATESLHATAQMPGSPEVEHHTSLGKIFTILLVLIILAGIGYAAYLMGVSRYLPLHTSNTPMITQAVQKIIPTATPTPDPTAPWSTYSNTKYGYSVRYPLGLTPNEVSTYYHYVEFKNASNSASVPPYLISVIPSSFTVKNIAAYNFMSADFISALDALRTGESATNSGSTFIRLPDISIDGQAAVVVSVSATGIKQQRVYLKTATNIYMLSTNYQSQAELNNFNLFLSTFKIAK